MAGPLMVRVNQIVSFHFPQNTELACVAGSQAEQVARRVQPRTVLFLSWSDANPRHIAKYIEFYANMWPQARIVCVETGLADFFYRSTTTSRKLIEPVVKVLSETADTALLVHIMSNAGSKQWCTIDSSLRDSTGRTLSNAKTVIDSAPGRSRFKQTWAALLASLPQAYMPKLVLGTLFGMVLCVMHLRKYLLPEYDVSEAVRTQMNDCKALSGAVRRCYIYTTGDKIVAAEDVVDHADEAESKGWTVDLVGFEGSTHVGHFRHDPTRYRQAIKRTWFGSP